MAWGMELGAKKTGEGKPEKGKRRRQNGEGRTDKGNGSRKINYVPVQTISRQSPTAGEAPAVKLVASR